MGIASPVTWASAFGYLALKISWFRLFTGPGGRFGVYLRISRHLRPTLAFWVLAGSCSCASVRRSESHHFTLPCSKLELRSSPDQKSVSSVSGTEAALFHSGMFLGVGLCPGRMMCSRIGSTGLPPLGGGNPFGHWDVKLTPKKNCGVFSPKIDQKYHNLVFMTSPRPEDYPPPFYPKWPD